MYAKNAIETNGGKIKYDHIKPVLKQLHWLPVNQCINYKILLLTYKTLNG